MGLVFAPTMSFEMVLWNVGVLNVVLRVHSERALSRSVPWRA